MKFRLFVLLLILFSLAVAGSVAAQPETFTAHLSGGEEVPDNNSKATGQAVFKLRDDGLHYKVIVANIQNVTMAHIHVAPAGENGPIVAWLYPGGPPAQLIPGRSSGILAEGVITDNDVVGIFSGDLEALLEAMRAGNTYVNVHTSQFPGGEVRGQIR
jgi:hypothetical protein